MHDKKLNKQSSLSALIDRVHKKMQVWMELKTRSTEAEKFPCMLCLGSGYLVKTIKFSRPLANQKYIKNKDGNEYVAYELCDCPECDGMGVDHNAITEFIKSNGVAA